MNFPTSKMVHLRDATLEVFEAGKRGRGTRGWGEGGGTGGTGGRAGRGGTGDGGTGGARGLKNFAEFCGLRHLSTANSQTHVFARFVFDALSLAACSPGHLSRSRRDGETDQAQEDKHSWSSRAMRNLAQGHPQDGAHLSLFHPGKQ